MIVTIHGNDESVSWTMPDGRTVEAQANDPQILLDSLENQFGTVANLDDALADLEALIFRYSNQAVVVFQS